MAGACPSCMLCGSTGIYHGRACPRCRGNGHQTGHTGHPDCPKCFEAEHTIQDTLFSNFPKVSQVRHSDPPSAKRAAAQNTDHRQSQATRLLRWMYDHGPITADRALRELTEDGETLERGDWSTRLGTLCSDPVRPLAERAGEVPDTGRKGRERMVMSYRLTVWGRAEVETFRQRAAS